MSITFIGGQMEPKDLVKVWDAPDHSKLTPKQMSIRLPVLAAAKFATLAEMYPSKSKSQMLADLVATALDQVIDALPSKKGALIAEEPDHIMDDDLRRTQGLEQNVAIGTVSIYEDIGAKGQFLRLLKKNMRKIEKEAGIEEAIETPVPTIAEWE
jgi:hypothetical protein